MSGYSEGWGQSPMNCNICGARVHGEMCERHIREPGYIALRDKYVGIFVIRKGSELSRPQLDAGTGSHPSQHGASHE